MSTYTKIKEQTELEKKIEEFLASGGEIEHVPYGKVAPKIDYKKRGWGQKKEKPSEEAESEE